MQSTPSQDGLRQTRRGLQRARVLLAFLLTGLAGVAFAQPATPADETASSSLPTALSYQPALADYRPYADPALQPWREANDRVGQIGGWRAYAKEVATGVPAATKDAGKVPPGGHERMHVGGSQR